MEIKRKYIIFFLIILKEFIIIYSQTLQFSANLISNIEKSENYVRQAVSDKYNCIISAEDEKSIIHISLFDKITGRFIKDFFSYESNSLSGGEAIFLDNSKFLLISNLDGYYNLINIDTETKKQWTESHYGYRRTFLNDGTDYYEEFIDSNDYVKLCINKYTFKSYVENFPTYQLIKTNTQSKQKKWCGMASCDVTSDKKNILCAFYSEDTSVNVAVYSSDLAFITNKKYEPLNYYGNGDNFIKIVYLNGNYNFVIINSQDDSISRLRFINYQNSNINDQLKLITNNDMDYLDIDNTQKNLHNAEIDIIAVDSDKVIKLYVSQSDNTIIITIFQFYSSNKGLSIKIYEFENNEGYSIFYQGRLNLIKNSYLISFSAEKDGIRRPFYSIINYPNSKDQSLTKNDNIIIIKNLIWLENSFLNLDLKFKVKSIPNDFIFIDMNSKVIQINDELDLNNKLILRQYRINGGSYILNFEPIARGSDNNNGYKYFHKYGTVKNSDIYFGGREGKIIIIFNDCLDGYYHFDYDMNLCSNVKPKNYCIDEINKIYIVCPFPKYNNTEINQSDFDYIKNLILNNYNHQDLLSGNDIEIRALNRYFTLTTQENQKNNKNNQKTTIDLKECGNLLKRENNISLNDNLIISKYDIREEGMKIPKIEYEVYFPFNSDKLTQLNLSICKDIKMDIYIPIKLDDDFIKYNPKSEYYNNICYKANYDNSDISLFDRKNIFIDNNMTLCEEDCELIDYNYTTEEVKCSCLTKIELPFLDEIKFDKNKLKKSFTDIKIIANINFLKCYKMYFRVNIILV